MLVTPADIEKLILDAKAAGVPPEEIQELQEHLEDIKSGKLMNKAPGGFAYNKVDSEGRRVLREHVTLAVSHYTYEVFP